MTTNVDIANRAMLTIGSRNKIISLSQDSIEAQSANVIINVLRDDLLRMAPWNCATNFANLIYITSVPGTPENTSPGTTLWQKGQPPPPWAYEYQYPVDCLRPLFIVPQFQTGFSGGVPITTAVTGGAASWWQGPPVRFKVGVDQFFGVVSASIANGGIGYVVGDTLILANGPVSSPPIGGPAQLLVTNTAGSPGPITSVNVLQGILGAVPTQSGSYFVTSQVPVGVGTVIRGSGAVATTGTGATFNLTYTAQESQRVILTNQEFALLCYIKQITDPNVMDQMFVEAWVHILSARLTMTLTGDKSQANMLIQAANNQILEARKADGNEGMTINDVTPDWIRARGIDFSCGMLTGPYNDFNWGNLFPLY